MKPLSPIARNILLVSVIIFGGITLGSYLNHDDAEDYTEIKRQIAVSKAWRARFADLVKLSNHRDTVIVGLRTNANKAMDDADILNMELKDLEAYNPNMESTDNPEAMMWWHAFNKRSREASLLRIANDNQQQINVVLTADRDSWKRLAFSGDSVISGNVTVMERSVCKIVFIPCPSRGVMFASGILSAIIIISAVKH